MKCARLTPDVQCLKEIAVKDSVFTTSHAIAMIEALRSGSEELLAEACQDVLHEPCRRKLIKDYDSVRASAKVAGAPAFSSADQVQR